MNANACTFSVGEFECVVVSDGHFAYPQPARLLFANASVNELAVALSAVGLHAANWNEYVSPYFGLLIKTGGQFVLVDTGAGSLAPTTGRLISNLREIGIEPEAIGTVILTHAHPDHIGGNLDANGEPAFSRARYVISKGEWDFWKSDPDLTALKIDPALKSVIRDCPKTNLFPLESRLETAGDGEEIVPGIHFVSAPGHTPGHMAVMIQSMDKKLLHVADALVHPIHTEHPEWVTAIDLDQEATIETRRKILGLATAAETLVLASHFPWPSLGHVERQESGCQWIEYQADFGT